MDSIVTPAATSAPGFAGGFERPTYDSIKVFRAAANAMARPGVIHVVEALPPAPSQLAPACAALCLALLDMDTPVWMQNHQPLVAEYLRFHCGCPFTPHAREASYALITHLDAPPRLGAFNAGSAEYPDDSATLLIQAEALSNESGVTLSGPGLRDSVRLDVMGVDLDYWAELRDSRTAFPLGVDIFFVSGTRIAALPRTTSIEL
jgi:alpha-D-ribose 1-methylphosphonate 5-triphosphate synthase subunit PhnH